MSYSMESVEGPDHLHFRLSGVRNRKTGQQIIDTLVLAIAEKRRASVLLDFRTQDSATSVVDDYYWASHAADRLAGRCPKIACLVSANQHCRGNLMENVAINRGLRMRYFHDEEKAIEWLTVDHSTAPTLQEFHGLGGSPIESGKSAICPQFGKVG